MSKKDIRLDEIKELYDQLTTGDDLSNANEEDKILLYTKNQDLSEQILSIIEELLREKPLHDEALFWKIRIYNGPHYDDVSIMMSTAQEIIDNLGEDKKSVFSAFDWLAWIYENKLELKEKAIEILHDKLIEISLLKGEYSLQDREFGETYYRIAFLYRELEDFNTAVSFYRLCYEHYPDHYYATFQGGRLFLERGEYADAYIFIRSFYIFHGNEYCAIFGKEIEELYNAGKIDSEWGLLYLMYSIALDYPGEFGHKNIREVGLKFSPLVDKGLEADADNSFALKMKAQHYLRVEKNSKRAFEYLHRYFDQDKKILGPLYFIFYELGDRLGIDVDALGYEIDCDGFYGYNLMTRFIEKGSELRDNDETEKALKYYEVARKLGMHIVPIVEAYFEKGIGNKANNNQHGYAMLCNNLGIAIRNIVYLGDGDFRTTECYYALKLHRKGYEASPFWENMESGMRLAEGMKEYDEVAYFAKELLTYYDENTVSYLTVQGRILKNFININKYEEAELFFNTIKQEFEAKGVEDEDLVAEIIYMAADLFTYIRYEKNDYQRTIDLTEAFFSNPMYIELNEEVANVNYWFSLAWAYRGLENREKAAEYFELMIEHYGDNERYQNTIEDIPAEYKLPKDHREALNRLWDLSKVDVAVPAIYSLDEVENNVVHLNKIVNYITGGADIIVEGWIDDNVNLKVCPRSLRADKDEVIYDTSLDFYFQEENITIRYNIDERDEVVKSFLGLRSKKVWAKEMYVYYYFYTEGELSSTKYEIYGNGNAGLDAKAQALWNSFVSKYYQIAQ